jgi:FkbM family methyltransferase
MKRYWKIVRSQPHPIKFLLSRLLMKTRLCWLFTINQDGFTLRFYPSAASAKLWIDPTAKGTDSEFDLTFLASYLKEGDTVIDVGANIGRTTLAAAFAVGDRGKVIAVEPNPKVYQYLIGNVTLNRTKNVQAFNIAVGNIIGAVFLSDIKWDDMNEITTETQKDCITVSVNRLDQLIKAAQEIALLKIDVEGYEKFVLEGAGKLLDLTNCIYFEAYEKHFNKYDYGWTDLFDFLGSKGFSVFNISFRKETLSTVPRDYWAYRCENLVAIRTVDGFVKRTGFRLEA